MLMVASVGSIAQLSDSATFGWGAVTVYLIPAVMFLIPVGLVSAELATSNRGGIFVWVRDAYGDRSGFQATWFVFMNSVTLYPALLSFGAAALATALGRPGSRVQRPLHGRVVLVVFWIATAIVTRGMEASTGMSNIGLGLGTILPAAALIVFMFAWLVDAKPNQIPWDGISGLTPPVTGLSSIALIVGTFIAFAGLEVNAVHIDHLKGKPTNYLKSVLLAAAIVFVMYLLGSLAISVAVPDASLELTSGASQAFTTYAAGFGIPIVANILSGPAGLGRLRRLDRLDRRPEPQHVARRPRRLPATRAAEDQQERRADAAAAAPGRRCVGPRARVRRRPEHLVRVRDAAGHVGDPLHGHVPVHVRVGDQAAAHPARPSSARSRSADCRRSPESAWSPPCPPSSSA